MGYDHERREHQESRVRRYVPYPVKSDRVEDQQAVDFYLAGRRLDPALAAANGWYPSSSAGDNLLRVVIPAQNTAGFPFWQARTLAPSLFSPRYQSPHGVPREDSVVIVWPNEARYPKPGVVVVVEGPMDALAAAEYGVCGVALMGATPPLPCYDLIARTFQGKQVLILPDADERGAGARSLRELRLRGVTAWVRCLDCAKDLADLAPSDRAAVVSEI